MFRRIVSSGNSEPHEYTPIVSKTLSQVSPTAVFEEFLIDHPGAHRIRHLDLKLDLYVTTKEYITLQTQERFPAMEYYTSEISSKVIGYIDHEHATSNIIQLILAMGLRVRKDSFYINNETTKFLIYSPERVDTYAINKIYFELYDTLVIFGVYMHNRVGCIGVKIPVFSGEYVESLESTYNNRLWLFKKD